MADSPSINEMVMHARDYPFIAALTSIGPGLTINKGQELLDSTLGLLAAHADHVLVGAYDAEGFLNLELTSETVPRVNQ